MKYILMFVMLACAPAHARFVPPGQAAKAKSPVMDFFARNVYQASGITQADFNAGIDTVFNHYAPIVESKGFHLAFNRAWNDSTVNSDTDLEPDNVTWMINSYGGLARYQGMTKIGYIYVACHELGHHMGKAPIYTGENWRGFGAAVEGEADYWASTCMKELNFSAADIQAAALTVSSVLASLGGELRPNPSTPSRVVVRTTYQDHPPAQIRLDTYLAGARCPATGEFSQTDMHVNTCYYYPNGVASTGSRPRSWFAPSDAGSPEPSGGTLPVPTPTPVPTPVPTPPGGCVPPPPTCRWVCS